MDIVDSLLDAWPQLWSGIQITLQLSIGGAILGLLVATVLGLASITGSAMLRVASRVVVEFFRAVPVLLLMILVFYSWGINRGASGAYWSVVIALMLYNGAVLAEVFRAGIQAVPKGQSEAAYAIGMRKGQVTRIILLPQAVKIMLPAIISQMVVALKDTSLGYVVAAPGLTAIGKQIYQGFQNQVPTAIVIAALYVVTNLALTWVATWVQHRFVGEKKQLEVSAVPASAEAPKV